MIVYTVIKGLTGAWAYSLFGFISAAMLPLPWLLFKWGPQLRARSKYSEGMMNGVPFDMEGAHTDSAQDMNALESKV